ncbi:MAG: hypothetical protein KDC84_10435 [Crocinitomicaceae bacterium]|nr:hypothetical protein [Crocinitomicaceae bacterium]
MKIIIGISILAVTALSILYACSEDKWNERTREEFIEKCVEDGVTETSCHCILEKIESLNYSPSSLYSKDEKVKKAYEDAIASCLGL